MGQLAFERTAPIVRVRRGKFALLADCARVTIQGGRIELFQDASPLERLDEVDAGQLDDFESMTLATVDIDMLSGGHGRAAQVDMRFLLRMAVVQGAAPLVDVTRVTIDGCPSPERILGVCSVRETSSP